MIINIDNLNIYYEIEGKGKPILLLHGWGANIESLRPVITYLKNKFKVYILDLPGFGKSDIPEESWSNQDFANCILKFCQKLELTNLFVIAHSHGGRIAILLTAQYPLLIKRLVLVNSAGIRKKHKLSWYIRVYSYKFLKFILLKLIPFSLGKKCFSYVQSHFGSADYRQATKQGKMSETLVRVVNEDLSDFLSQIQIPVLIIWGELDEETPVSNAILMKEMIPNAELVILKDAAHFSYLDQFRQFCALLSYFLYRPNSQE